MQAEGTLACSSPQKEASGPESLAFPGAGPAEILPKPWQHHDAEENKLGPAGIHPNTAAHFWNILDKKKKKRSRVSLRLKGGN